MRKRFAMRRNMAEQQKRSRKTKKSGFSWFKLLVRQQGENCIVLLITNTVFLYVDRRYKMSAGKTDQGRKAELMACRAPPWVQRMQTPCLRAVLRHLRRMHVCIPSPPLQECCGPQPGVSGGPLLQEVRAVVQPTVLQQALFKGFDCFL